MIELFGAKHVMKALARAFRYPETSQGKTTCLEIKQVNKGYLSQARAVLSMGIDGSSKKEKVPLGDLSV
jgi:hypothetical protein